MKRQFRALAMAAAMAVGAGFFGVAEVRGEAMLQYFNMSWSEIAERVPELAEAGYTSIWLPPSAKANGGLSVGYDLFDPFDLGAVDQRGSYATRYGTEAELRNLVELLHRFGIRVYLDNIMNHRSYDVPLYNENTPTDIYPGMVAEDFHLRVTSDGFYRKWDNTRDWGDEWQVQNLCTSDLLDIAHETPNANFGPTEGTWGHPKPWIVRQANHPEYYDRMPHPSLSNADCNSGDAMNFDADNGRNLHVGFHNRLARQAITAELVAQYPAFFEKYGTNGVTTEMIEDYPNFYQEDVGAYLCRSVRYVMDRTMVDGFRLDAVKHVPAWFFGAQYGDDKDASNAGYIGNIQWQFNMSHGYSDWSNHRDTVYNNGYNPRDDAMVFGEHLGEPPSIEGYFAAGMRLVDNNLRDPLVRAIQNYWLQGFANSGYGGLAGNMGVMHSQSHDNTPIDSARRPLEHAFLMLRDGMALFYSDGCKHAESLSGAGGAFPRWADTPYLGQWGDNRMPNLCELQGNFGNGGWQEAVVNDWGNFSAWKRMDNRGGGDVHTEWVTMLVLANADWSNAQSFPGGSYYDSISFPHESGGAYGADAYLYQYADVPYVDWDPHFYTYASDLHSHAVPPNAYYVFGYKNPDPSALWSKAQEGVSDVLAIREDGVLVDTVRVVRKDGKDGDEAFNPHNFSDEVSRCGTNFSYAIDIPRITKGTNVTFEARVDGSAGNVLMKLDGGIDLNGVAHEGGDLRDNPPAVATDIYLGYEGVQFDQRIWPEKFASAATENCKIGSAGATSYERRGGVAETYPSTAVNDYSTGWGQVSFVYHDPDANSPATTVSGGSTNVTVATNTYVDSAAANGSTAAAIPGFGALNNMSSGASGWFAGTAGAEAGLTGFADATTYGLWANPADGQSAIVARPLTGAAGVQEFSVTLGMAWDSNLAGSYKGFEVLDGDGGVIFGVQQQDGEAVAYYGRGGLSGTWSAGYGTAAFTVRLARTATGYAVTGTTREGGTFGGCTVTGAVAIAQWKAYMNATDNDARRQLYYDAVSYRTVETNTVISGGTTNVVKQLSVEDGNTVVWAKTDVQGGLSARLYYTVGGTAWPEGAAGEAANRETRVAEGVWQQNEGDGSWWRFVLPVGASPTLRYKLGAYKAQGGENGWETVWPGSAGDVAKKTQMMGVWKTVPQDLTTKSYHPHNDYGEVRTGLVDGYHLVSARAFLNRNGGAPVYNTFRQTVYVDLETPQGAIAYPEHDGEEVGGTYGVVVRTDPSVTEVWFHVTDAYTGNDGVGNGFTTNGTVEWAPASQASAWTLDMATNQSLTKVWKFNYTAAPGGSNATIRVRLREVSSTPAAEWSPEGPAEDDLEALHVTELVRTVRACGENYYLRFDWPEEAAQRVEYGWEVRLKYNWEFAAGLDDDGARALFSAQFFSPTADGGTNVVTMGPELFTHQWNYPNENGLAFAMPNLYTGNDEDLHWMLVTGTRDGRTIVASNSFTTRGPLAPMCIIAQPLEYDSDGAKVVIEMPDSAEARTNLALRQTPIVVQTDRAVTNVALTWEIPSGFVGDVRLDTCSTSTNVKTWNYIWTVTNAGSYTFRASVWADLSANPSLGIATNSALRNATVEFRQRVSTVDTNDLDWDDDGIRNTFESTPQPVENGYDEYLTQAAAFAHYSYGKSSPSLVDTDNDGLPDGLELGFRTATASTDSTADMDGDGYPNFLADFDPPFYNCSDECWMLPGYKSGSGVDRLQRLVGSITDPNNPDSDYDGLPDGVEDADRNGWVDGDGKPFPPDWNLYDSHDWADGKINGDEVWEETSPNVADSDGDGLSDGYGEDKNANGRTDLFLLAANGTRTEITLEDYATLGIGIATYSTNPAYSGFVGSPRPYTSRAIDYAALFQKYATNGLADGTAQSGGWPKLIIAETDPLCADTDHDGLPDGWEARYGLSPLDNGTYDFATGGVGNVDNGPDGDPDEDGFTNLEEYRNGTNPRSPDGGTPVEGASIVIGEGPEIGTVNGVKLHREFLDWTLDDLVALDDYNRGGNSSDIYRFGDGFDSSRDMVAFYFRDGGASSAGGDDKIYFRVDFDDLKAFAEDGYLNIYVAINFGQYGSGEYKLPDEVNCGSEMGWNACVGVYDGQNGVLYVDKDRTRNTTSLAQDLGAFGVEGVAGFQGAYFNSELDAVAWSIDRRVLVEAGWNGIADNMLFQVYTTRDYTGDDGGSGDKGGLNDFTDTIGDDWLCSDYYQDYDYVRAHALFSWCVGRKTEGREDGAKVFNHLGKAAKLAMLAHGNQAVQPGSVVQGYVDNGSGAGYQRSAKIHNIYSNAPLNLHITPTLAISLQWAAVGTSNTWYSGVALNDEIRRGVSNGVIRLLGSTYSDHLLGYFSDAFNAANVALAKATLEDLYGAGSVSTNILWLTERTADANILEKLARLGFRSTVVDQKPHLQSWFGGSYALGSDAYKINRLWVEPAAGGDWPKVDAFVISSAADDFRYANTDSGLPTDLRQLFWRRASAGDGQVSSIFYRWEDLASTENADAYDRNLRWIANHPWIQVVAMEDLLDDDSVGRAEKDIRRSTKMQMQDWVNHACNESYDNWFYGSWRHEGLSPKVFEVRPGVPMPSGKPYGTMTNGILKDAWAAVAGLTNAMVKRLAEEALFASVFETAFHDETNNDLSRWSYGEYIYPASDWTGLIGFAWSAQGQTRMAALFAEVDAWAQKAASAPVEAFEKDVDLDGEAEVVLRNGRVMMLFEKSGGRMVGAWAKQAGKVWQIVGNFASIVGTGWEDEGPSDVGQDGEGNPYLDAYRASVLKDKWDATAGTDLVNAPYVATLGSDRVTFAGNGVSKTVSLAAGTNLVAVSYSMPGHQLYVRNGFSPDLHTLLVRGQDALSEEGADSTSALTLRTAGADGSVAVKLAVTAGSINTAASDKDGVLVKDTVNMRNLAQTRQVEISGTDAIAFTMAFEATENTAPEIAFSPAGPYVTAVGSNLSFAVSASDPDGDAVALSAENLPAGASFDAATGAFAWPVANLGTGGRTNDETLAVAFVADDGTATTSADASITVLWDANGNGMGDDWEYLKFGGCMTNAAAADSDGDGFANYSEWIAGTDPAAPGSYIGWISQSVTKTATSTNLALTFLSVPGGTYQIEWTDSPGLVAGSWSTLATGVVSQGDTTTWIDEGYLSRTNSTGMYRIKVPFCTAR